MLTWFDPLRTFSLLSVAVRLVLAVLLGGIIGIEREYKRRPAGFRTHILICLGASITTLTSQYLDLVLGYDTDPARLGAQVVAGIGFIGAGAIIVTRRQQVKGLTTAAGLWTAAIIGLCLGCGFYEGALAATFLILAAELLFSRLEYRILRQVPEMRLYLEYGDQSGLEAVLELCRTQDIRVLNMEITRPADSHRHCACAIFTLQLSKKTCGTEQLAAQIQQLEGVVGAEVL